MKRRKKQNKKNYIICILLVVIIIAILLLVKFLKSPKEVEIKASALRIEETTNYSNELKVYLEPYLRDGVYNICYDEDTCGKEYLTIKTETTDAYLLENYKYKYFFYTDGDKVKVYDTSEKKSYSFDKLKSNYNCDFIINNEDDLIGVVYSTDINDHSNYLLVDGNEILYKGKYDYMISIGPKYLAANKYDKDGNQIGAYIINANKEEKPLISKEFITDEYYGFYDLGNKYITFEYSKKFEIYDNDTLKLIYKSNKANLEDGNGYPRFLYGVDSKDNIYIYDDKYLSILDSGGKEIKKSKNEIYGIDLIDKYILNTDNKTLTIIDIDGVSYQIASLINGNIDYYEYVKTDQKEGILFEIYDKTLAYKDVYNLCKNDKCKDLTFSEFKKDYEGQLGYDYFFDYKTLKVTKTPTVIAPTNIVD